jgi:hypothetical protein
MSLGTTISINTGTIADPVLVVLPLLYNDKASGSEYQLKESDRTHTVLVRHSTDKNRVNGQLMDRHVVTYRQFILPTTVYPQGLVKEAYTVFRVPATLPLADVQDVINGCTNAMIDPVLQGKVINGES